MAEHMVPGVYITEEEYNKNRSEVLTSSALKLILYSPRSYERQYINGIREDLEHFTVGHVFHGLVLEPEKIKEQYLMGYQSYNPKTMFKVKKDLVREAEALGIQLTYRDDLEENRAGVLETVAKIEQKIDSVIARSGKKDISAKSLHEAKNAAKYALDSVFPLSMFDQTLEDMTLRDLLAGKNEKVLCYVERTFYGEIMNVPFQIRTDLLMKINGHTRVCVDLKSAWDDSIFTFQRAIGDYRYDLQQWIYTEILRQNRIALDHFIFCLAGKSDNSGCSYHKIGPESMKEAQFIVMRGIDKYKRCKANSEWVDGKFDYETGRAERIPTTELPMYARYALENIGITLPKKNPWAKKKGNSS